VIDKQLTYRKTTTKKACGIDWSEKEGGWVLPVTLQNDVRLRLEKSLERQLSSNEVATIEREIAFIQHMQTGFETATTQSVKRTLGSIAKLPAAEARAAYRQIDSDTACRIDEAMCVHLGMSPDSLEWQNPSGENIAKAAKAALENMGKGKNGGAPLKQYQRDAARFAVSTWRKFGGKNMSVSRRTSTVPQYFSPLMQWARALFYIVDNRDPDPKQLEELLKEALKK